MSHDGADHIPPAPMKNTLKILMAAAMSVLMAAPVMATFVDFDPNAPGSQTASWPAPSTIKIYIPDGIAGDARMNFEMGIQIWGSCLPGIMLMFVTGEPPGDTGVNVDLCQPGSIVEGGTRRFGLTLAESFHEDGQMHGTITAARLKIDMDALGNLTFMKNLGAHEFGHVLGLDDDPRPAGTMRVNVMDADFNASSPFIGLSARDKKMLMEHYRAPEVGSQWALFALAALGLGMVKRFSPVS